MLGDLMLCPKCDVTRFGPPLTNNVPVLFDKNDTNVTTKNNVKAKQNKLNFNVTNATSGATSNNPRQSNSNQSQLGPDIELVENICSHQLDKQQLSCLRTNNYIYVY